MIKTYIKRDNYLKKISPFIGKEMIKVIVGQRRVGKSYLLYQIMDEIQKKNKRANCIYINKELYKFDRIKNYHHLLTYVKNHTRKGKTHVFIDEIQDIGSFEKALRSLVASKNYDIYCTGSNARLLSGELATYLSGRFIEIPVYSLSFIEFLKFHNLPKENNTLMKYIRYGGLPYLIHLDLSDEIIYGYLQSITNTIILKDVVQRYTVRNVNLLQRLVEYLSDNIGSLVSAKKISDFLKSQHTDISPNTILNYLSFLTSSFIVYKVSRMDVIGKKIFEISEKYYWEDLGLRHTLVGYKQSDINKILENLVFSHLLYLGYKVTVGQLGNKDVDFVALKEEKRIYIQVAYLITSEKVKRREFGNLLLIPDNYLKIVVSMDELAKGDYKGIRQMHILDFLTASEL